MTYSLHPGAEQDVVDALDFYGGKAGQAVADRFLEEFERVAKLLAEHPGLGTPTTRGRRAFPMGVFRYSIVYRSHEESFRLAFRPQLPLLMRNRCPEHVTQTLRG